MARGAPGADDLPETLDMTVLIERIERGQGPQERLGHSSIQITLDLYSHVVPGMQADAAAKIGALLRSGT
jgi:integrase